jgi:hypothetical protein
LRKYYMFLMKITSPGREVVSGLGQRTRTVSKKTHPLLAFFRTWVMVSQFVGTTRLLRCLREQGFHEASA